MVITTFSEPTLKAGTPILTNLSAAALEKGVLINIFFIFIYFKFYFLFFS